MPSKQQLDTPFSRVFFAGMIRLYQDIPWGESVARLREIWSLPA